MHRVVTKYFDHRGNWIIDSGPWHISREDAENWASILRHLGYAATIETQGGKILEAHEHDDLKEALASMA